MTKRAVPIVRVATFYTAILVLGVPGLLLLSSVFLGCIAYTKHRPWIYTVTEVANFGRLLLIIFLYRNLETLSVSLLLPLVIFWHFLKVKCKPYLWTLVLLILLSLNASVSIYLHYDTLETMKEREELTCATAYLHVLSVIALFQGSLERGTTQQGFSHAYMLVYMLGAVGLIFVNSIALAVELILKAREYTEVVHLRVISSEVTAQAIKDDFAHHGIPEDNFIYTTSSLSYPQANGEVERAVRTLKGLLAKEKDHRDALLAYRATPLEQGFSSSQLLMGRRLHTTLP
ncbi:uncharacterized protein LOC118800277 [Colossoma macropomum]|uniref:uncharacterized protein LOC118800277 n=1 Tax=Colossoma macropomum TaxID=42526 RepID=UPI00186430CF|nr:uncharacterized protein LOC118800277 [Colossoma macropomum]